MAATLYPLTFNPIFQERLWGGRRLEQLYDKNLPANLRIGESWETSDRPEAMSTVNWGPLKGRTLHSLAEQFQGELMGATKLSQGRFPLLLKILDAAEKLSLQVHPPASVAARLQGEPKTELWYVTAATADAELYVGLRRGVSREDFEQRLRTGMVAECIHRVTVTQGSAMFVPSGRVHGIGAGCVIFEIQQNSDTTYRVFDWNRVGADGKPRALHKEESLMSINFNDPEPPLVDSAYEGTPEFQTRPLASCPYFDVAAVKLSRRISISTDSRPTIVAVSGGELSLLSGHDGRILRAGDFCLLPACLGEIEFAASSAEFLVIRAL
jgi:mannose-6-phosphate isomerase